jgi:hypothetical protein
MICWCLLISFVRRRDISTREDSNIFKYKSKHFQSEKWIIRPLRWSIVVTGQIPTLLELIWNEGKTFNFWSVILIWYNILIWEWLQLYHIIYVCCFLTMYKNIDMIWYDISFILDFGTAWNFFEFFSMFFGICQYGCQNS